MNTFQGRKNMAHKSTSEKLMFTITKISAERNLVWVRNFWYWMTKKDKKNFTGKLALMKLNIRIELRNFWHLWRLCRAGRPRSSWTWTSPARPDPWRGWGWCRCRTQASGRSPNRRSVAGNTVLVQSWPGNRKDFIRWTKTV